MFDPREGPRLFGMPPGADFPADLVAHILTLTKDQPPEVLARVRVLASTRRMARRIGDLFAAEGARLLPRIGVVTDLSDLLPLAEVAPPHSALSRRLHLARLIKALIDADPSIAPRAAVFDLADSLSGLLDELEGENVRIDEVLTYDTGDQSGHWQRAQAFLRIVRTFLETSGQTAAGGEALRAALVRDLEARWNESPPKTPVIIAGSTGSRGTTLRLMRLVADLPQGAVVLPGVDTDCPSDIWESLVAQSETEDHPQFRFARLFRVFGCDHTNVEPWPSSAPDPERNRLISLALRPAPVTNQWLRDGPALGDLMRRTTAMSLVEAPHARAEAAAIAVVIREAVENQRSTALITPDRTLARRVAAALARWDIKPDDSAGRPLSLTAPGQLLRQIASLMEDRVGNDDLIALLKHPLARSDARGTHLLFTRELELFLRRKSLTRVDATTLAPFASRTAARGAWVTWLLGFLADLADPCPDTLADRLHRHIALSERLSSGESAGAGTLWDTSTGRDVRSALQGLETVAETAPELDKGDYRRLIDQILMGENTRNPDDTRPDVMIWGTLEARVQGADLVILGGLNEGTWPAAPRPDPWLSRKMRRDLGLLMPDREIGLSAHDFQQAVGAKNVVLTRALRDAEAETVPSRWLNRLMNLLTGLPDQNGREALQAMRERGKRLLTIAEALDAPTKASPEPRPAPAPPLPARPRALSITDVQKLIRDPYAIYARHILGLPALKPLHLDPGPAMKGVVFHLIMERFTRETVSKPELLTEKHFLRRADETLLETVPWPAVRTHWRGHLARIASHVIAEEKARRQQGRQIAFEVWGEMPLPGTDMTIKGMADRIDRLTDDRLAIYDYKTGNPPSAKVIRYFDRQLLIEAVMAEHGAFADIAKASVSHVGHIGLGRTPKSADIALVDDGEADYRTVTIQAELRQLLLEYRSESKGYTARRAMETVRYDGDYDHLSRFGEWDISDDPVVQVLP